MVQNTLKIHTENLLPIIKKWLYSDRDIFVRELISNSCDALKKLQILRDQGLCNINDDELKIEVFVDKDNKQIRFCDTGIGMSAEEVEKYIAQVAFSGAEEFLSKYSDKDKQEQIIGHFGLGFYSAYMVAKTVTLETKTYLEGVEGARWICDGSSTYDLEPFAKTSRGTDITLHIDDENAEFLEEERLEDILNRYCLFLPFPIFLNGNRINEKEPLWLKKAGEYTDEEANAFYHTLYPTDPDPIFSVHLNVDYPFKLQGILYFPKINQRVDWEKSHINLYCNRVFVSDNCQDLLPEYLVFLKGAIDSSDIPLNVSRSALQRDKTVRQIAGHISKKIADKLAALHQTDLPKFTALWPDLEFLVKLAMVQDDKFFDKGKEFLLWKTQKGSFTTLEGKSGTLLYTNDEHSPLLSLYPDQEIFISTSPIDTSLMHHLERKLSLTFQRLDGALDPNLLDASREKTLLDNDGQTEGTKLSALFRSHFPDLTVEAKSLVQDAVPTLLIVDEKERRFRDYLKLSGMGEKMGGKLPELKRTLILNTNSPLVMALPKLKERSPELASELARHLYDSALFSQNELEPEKVAAFTQRANRLMEKLI